MRSPIAPMLAFSVATLLAASSCDSPSGDGGKGGKGGAARRTLAAPGGAKQGDELVITVRASVVSGSWSDTAHPGAVVTVKAGGNLARDIILVGGFAQETAASLGTWDGGELTWTIDGDASFDLMEVSVDPSVAGVPVITLMSDAVANDTPLLVFRSGDELEYVMTNEDGGTGLFPTLLVAQWGRPHDIEGLFDVVSLTYQGENHETLTFEGPFDGGHPRLRMATANGLVAPEVEGSSVRYHVSPVPVSFTTSKGVPRERVLDQYPWLVAAGWLEVEREGKVAPAGGPEDGLLGAMTAYVFIDYSIEGGALVSFEAEVDGTYYSSLGTYAGKTDALDARSSGTGRTAIKLPAGKTMGDVTSVRVVREEGIGELVSARALAFDGASYEAVIRGDIAAPVALDMATTAVDLAL